MEPHHVVLVDALDVGGQGVDETLDASLAAVVGVTRQRAPRLVDNVPGEDGGVVLVRQAIDAVDPVPQQVELKTSSIKCHKTQSIEGPQL